VDENYISDKKIQNHFKDVIITTIKNTFLENEDISDEEEKNDTKLYPELRKLYNKLKR